MLFGVQHLLLLSAIYMIKFSLNFSLFELFCEIVISTHYWIDPPSTILSSLYEQRTRNTGILEAVRCGLGHSVLPSPSSQAK